MIPEEVLGYAHAGDFTPGFVTKVRSLLYGSGTIESLNLMVGQTVVVDISFYQAFANFEQLKFNGVQGAIIRAGQNLWADTHAEVFMDDAETAGMPFGSYWFYDSRISPKEQAYLWSQVLKGHDTKLMCWADYEERYGGTYKGWRAFYDFLEWCKVYMPERKFGIYTGYYYWVENSPNPITQAGSLNYFAQYPLWLAWYTLDPSIVKIPKPWNRITLWQYTDKGDGKVMGVGSFGLDMNTFDGTKEEFKIFFGLEATPPPPPDEEEENVMYEVVSDTYNMSLRTERSVFSSKVATVPVNTLMIADQIAAPSSGGMAGDSWAHIPSITLNGVIYSGWVAVIHNGEVYCDVTPISTNTGLPNVLYIATKEDMSDKTKYLKAV